jgi:protein subunit release factor A
MKSVVVLEVQGAEGGDDSRLLVEDQFSAYVRAAGAEGL